MFLHNLLNVLVQIANKMGLQKKNLVVYAADMEAYIPRICLELVYNICTSSRLAVIDIA
jgi:hypothetical protein